MDTLGKHRKYLYESGGEQIFIQKDKLTAKMRAEENDWAEENTDNNNKFS